MIRISFTFPVYFKTKLSAGIQLYVLKHILSVVKDTWNNSHQSYHNSNCNVFVGCHISFDSSDCVQIPFTDNRMSTDKINTPSPTTRDIRNQNCSHQHFGNQIDIPVTSPPREIPSSREQATPKENVLPSNISIKCSKDRWDTLQKYKYK